MLNERLRIRSDCGRNKLRRYLNYSSRLKKVGGRAQADGAVSFAVVAAGLIDVRGERGAGQQEDNGQTKRQKSEAPLTGYVFHVHLQRLDDS